MAQPATKQQLRSFLGMAGFCRVWIPTYGLLVKPLYEALKGPEDLTLEWTPDMEAAFKQIKKARHGPSPRSTRSDKTVLSLSS